MMLQYKAIILSLLLLLVTTEFAGGADAWRSEFEEVCGKSSEAAILSVMELQSLIAKGERVKTALEGESESVRIVYLKRVQKCMDLYHYIIESRQPEGNLNPPVK